MFVVIDGVKTVKARLTVRGFEDLSASTVETYANTATRWGQRLICSGLFVFWLADWQSSALTGFRWSALPR